MTPSLLPRPGTRLVVVGGCGGIGLALVHAAVALDLRVTVFDLATSLATTPLPARVTAHPLDVTDEAAITAAFATLTDGIDALVNLAGFTLACLPISDLTQADWHAVLAANLTGAFLIARAALPLLRAAATPHAPTTLIHVASGLAQRVQPGYGPYSAAKAGLISLTKTLALENAPLVRANAVAPGAVDTAFLTGGTGRAATPQRLDPAAHAASIPMRRIATPDDVSLPILFLCGPGAAHMTGQVLWINGGGYMP